MKMVCWMRVFLLLLAADRAMAAVIGSNSTEGPTVTEFMCTHADGHVYAMYDLYNPDPCTACKCYVTGEVCHKPCPEAPCLAPVPGECCPHCPNGPDCLGHNYELIESGTITIYSENHYCECPRLSADEIAHDHHSPRKPACHMDRTPPTITPQSP